MFLDNLKDICKSNLKKIVFPEALDIRILEAARYLKDNNILIPILIGDNNVLKLAEENNININDIELINQKSYKDIDLLINSFYNLRKHKGITEQDAKNEIENNNLIFANMLVKEDIFDGVVAGNISSSRDTIKASLQTIGAKEKASSFFIIELQDNKILLYSDCGLNIDPNEDDLVEIAKQSNDSFISLVQKTPKVAFLSHSTNNSSLCLLQEKMHNATKKFKEKYPNIISDGEMQFDCAINYDVCKIKYPNSEIKGDANILIFPNLDSANIAYKITERLANANAYGPIIQGLNKPSNDLSRGSSVESIIGVAIITAIQAINGNV